jgi:hypothetical protein
MSHVVMAVMLRKGRDKKGQNKFAHECIAVKQQPIARKSPSSRIGTSTAVNHATGKNQLQAALLLSFATTRLISLLDLGNDLCRRWNRDPLLDKEVTAACSC